MAANSMQAKKSTVVFEDLLPSMAARLGAEGFMEEICKGFRLLADEEKGLITFQSLKRRSKLLGIDLVKGSKGIFGTEGSDNDEDGEEDEEIIREMLREGDLDGDECLNEMEFCVLMFRLSPGLMEGSKHWLQDSLFC